MSGLVPFSRKGMRPARTNDGFYNMLDDFFSDSWAMNNKESFKMDVRESDTEYTVEAYMPGVKKEEVNLEMNDGRLTIDITRDKLEEDAADNYLHKESIYTSMQRSVYLVDAKNDGVKAELKEGILKIRIPKDKENPTKKKIDID